MGVGERKGGIAKDVRMSSFILLSVVFFRPKVLSIKPSYKCNDCLGFIYLVQLLVCV